MPDLTTGDLVTPLDRPPTVSASDITQLFGLSNTSYAAGTPEVGVTFVAPTTGRVIITVGGGARDDTNDNRVFLSPQVFEDDASGTEILAPSVTSRGFGSVGETAEVMYASRTSLLDGLTPGQVYYARVMHVVTTTGGSTADINSREISVGPAS